LRPPFLLMTQLRRASRLFKLATADSCSSSVSAATLSLVVPLRLTCCSQRASCPFLRPAEFATIDWQQSKCPFHQQQHRNKRAWFEAAGGKRRRIFSQQARLNSAFHTQFFSFDSETPCLHWESKLTNPGGSKNVFLHSGDVLGVPGLSVVKHISTAPVCLSAGNDLWWTHVWLLTSRCFKFVLCLSGRYAKVAACSVFTVSLSKS